MRNNASIYFHGNYTGNKEHYFIVQILRHKPFFNVVTTISYLFLSVMNKSVCAVLVKIAPVGVTYCYHC